MGGRLGPEAPQRLACRRRRLRKRHQHDRHRDAANLAAHVEQRTASYSKPGGSLPAGLRANADPLAERRPEQLDRQVGIGIRDGILEWPRDAMGPIRRTKHRGQRAGAIDDRIVEAKPGDVIAHARLHGVHEPWLAMASLRGAYWKPCRVE